MSASAVANERTRLPRAPRRARRGPATDAECRDGFGATLEEAVAATLAELAYSGRAACPFCGASELEPTGCNTCGSVLS
jgi:DnaJ-class molecular chaperone